MKVFVLSSDLFMSVSDKQTLDEKSSKEMTRKFLKILTKHESDY